MSHSIPLEDRERLEKQRRQWRDAGLRFEDSFTDLAFALERFSVALIAAKGPEGDHKETLGVGQ
jgi:hypothetical protein